jgi:cysteine desulfurase
MIYLDFNASTPVLEPVLEAMLPWFKNEFANASSAHLGGRRALVATEAARDKVAELLGCANSEIVFTSGATESINLALQGTLGDSRNRILVSATEHKAVLETCHSLEGAGITTDVVPVDRFGVIDLSALEELLGPDVLTVSVMAANNETGTLNPVRAVAQLAARWGVLVHTDATQWVGKLPVDVRDWGIDLLSFSGHKFYAPKGVGALFVRNGLHVRALVHGGGQERGLRSGSYDVPGIVGLGAAAELARLDAAERPTNEMALRDRLHRRLAAYLPKAKLNGHPTSRLPNTINLSFEGTEGDAVVARPWDVAISSGSACTSSVAAPSHVLTAMGVPPELANASLRFSLGRTTTASDVDLAADRIAEVVSEVQITIAAMAGSFERGLR